MEDGVWKTNGGRVLNAIGIGSSLEEAKRHAYEQVSQITWKAIQVRSDIGDKVITS